MTGEPTNDIVTTLTNQSYVKWLNLTTRLSILKQKQEKQRKTTTTTTNKQTKCPKQQLEFKLRITRLSVSEYARTYPGTHAKLIN